MKRHRHDWFRDERHGCTENPGCWSDGAGGFIYHEVCACGLQRREHRPLNGPVSRMYRVSDDAPWIRR